MNQSRKSGLRLAVVCSLLSVMLVLLVGCANLVISTLPPGGQIVLKDANGRQLTRGPAPLATHVSFASDHDKYVVEAVPSEAAKDRYVSTVKELDKAQYDLLPGGNKKEFEITLDEKTYTVMLDVTIFLADGWMG